MVLAIRTVDSEFLGGKHTGEEEDCQARMRKGGKDSRNPGRTGKNQQLKHREHGEKI
jgi:hypothetical protein